MMSAHEAVLRVLNKRGDWMAERDVLLALGNGNVGHWLAPYCGVIDELVRDGLVLSQSVVVGHGNRVLARCDGNDDVSEILQQCRQNDPSATLHTVLRAVSDGGSS